MSEEMPPDWCFEEVMSLANKEVGWACWRNVEEVKGNALGRVFARIIHKTQEEPVDPLVQATREICALMADELGSDLSAKYYRDGEYDHHFDFQEVLERLQAIKEGRS